MRIYLPQQRPTRSRTFSLLTIFFSPAETDVTPQAPVLTVPANRSAIGAALGRSRPANTYWRLRLLVIANCGWGDLSRYQYASEQVTPM